MKLDKRRLILISLIIPALALGTFVGTALSDCSCDPPDYDECGEPGDNCCACDPNESDCIHFEPNEDCVRLILYPSGKKSAHCDTGCS